MVAAKVRIRAADIINSKKSPCPMKRLAWITVAFLLLLAAFPAIGLYLNVSEEPIAADVIVVISGGDTPARAQRGIALYEQGFAPLLIFSGRNIDPRFNDAVYMAALAREAGVPEGAILIEDQATTTLQNAEESERILQTVGADSILLVTSPYHLRRAALTFERVLGPEIAVHPVAAVDQDWSKRRWWASWQGVSLSLQEMSRLFYIYLTRNLA